MSDDQAPDVRRLLVALDAMRCVAADFDAAMDLAVLIGAELRGLFVQDADLLGLASLPIAHEVGRLSGQSRPLARESVESVLQRRVERTVSELERAGKRRNVAVTHVTARGKLVRQALARGEHGDVVFLVGPSVRSERVRARSGGRIMLWYDAGPSAELSIELALYLARRTGSELLVGFPAERFASAAELRAHLGALLESAPRVIQLIAFSNARIDAILEAARTGRITRLVLGADGPLVSAEALEYLCGAFRGELILVR